MFNKQKKRMWRVSGITMLVALSLGMVSVEAPAADMDKPVFEFQRKMAASGNAKAQFFLAQMYEQGRGTAIDKDQAEYWYEQAKKNGYTSNEQVSAIY